MSGIYLTPITYLLMHPINQENNSTEKIICTTQYCKRMDDNELQVLDLREVEINEPVTVEKVNTAVKLFLSDTDSLPNKLE